LARHSALNDRAENDRVIIADLPEMKSPKTRDLVAFVSAIDVPGKVLLLTDGVNKNLYLSSRNLSTVSVVPFGEESVYDVLWAHTVLIERGALETNSSLKEPEEIDLELDSSNEGGDNA
jgi:large subunit ribosomal protein L4